MKYKGLLRFLKKRELTETGYLFSIRVHILYAILTSLSGNIPRLVYVMTCHAKVSIFVKRGIIIHILILKDLLPLALNTCRIFRLKFIESATSIDKYLEPERVPSFICTLVHEFRILLIDIGLHFTSTSHFMHLFLHHLCILFLRYTFSVI
jgi:hypothetical protein